MNKSVANQTIGNNVRRYRKIFGLSQQALGDELGLTFQQIQKYEKGVSALTPDKLLSLTRIFHCSLDDLFCDTPVWDCKPDEFPEDLYKVQTLLRHFSLISSHEARDIICIVAQALSEKGGQFTVERKK